MSEAATLEERAIPLALATLRKRGQGWVWIVENCPRCGGRHVHYGGLGDDPRLHLGVKTAHCQGVDLTTTYRRVERGP